MCFRRGSDYRFHGFGDFFHTFWWGGYCVDIWFTLWRFYVPIINLWVFISPFLIKLTVTCSNYGSIFCTAGVCGDFSHRYHLPAPMVRNILYCHMRSKYHKLISNLDSHPFFGHHVFSNSFGTQRRQIQSSKSLTWGLQRDPESTGLIRECFPFQIGYLRITKLKSALRKSLFNWHPKLFEIFEQKTSIFPRM